MFKKITAGVTAYVLCCSLTTSAQASLKCYTPRKAGIKANWTIGIRTGVIRPYYDDYFKSSIGLKQLKWAQQIFVQRDISKSFMLELHLTHHNFQQDSLPYTHHPGRVYTRSVRNNQRLQNNLILYYIFPEVIERLKTGVGIGVGIVVNRTKTEESYNEAGITKEQQSSSLSLSVPNIYWGLTASYKVKYNVSLTSQLNISGFPNRDFNYAMLAMGLSFML